MPREYAAKIKAMIGSIKQENDKLKKLGLVEAEQCELILELQQDKVLWPMILAAIHDSLPVEVKLASAADGVAYVRAILDDPDG